MTSKTIGRPPLRGGLLFSDEKFSKKTPGPKREIFFAHGRPKIANFNKDLLKNSSLIFPDFYVGTDFGVSTPYTLNTETLNIDCGGMFVRIFGRMFEDLWKVFGRTWGLFLGGLWGGCLGGFLGGCVRIFGRFLVGFGEGYWMVLG